MIFFLALAQSYGHTWCYVVISSLGQNLRMHFEAQFGKVTTDRQQEKRMENVQIKLFSLSMIQTHHSWHTGNRQCRAHGLQNARISCGEVNVRSRAYPLNTSDLWRFWRTFLEFCCGAYVFRYQRLLRGFALLLFGPSGAIGNSCRVELVGCLPFPSPMGLSSGWKALRVQQG